MPKCSRSSILILCPTVRLKKYTIVCFLTGRLLAAAGAGVARLERGVCPNVQMSKCYCIHSSFVTSHKLFALDTKKNATSSFIMQLKLLYC